MRITFIMIGKTSFGFVKDGMDMYEKRIAHYIGFDRIEIPAINGTSSLSKEELKEKEGDLLQKKLKDFDEIILLDEKGKRYTSIAWAKNIEDMMIRGKKNIAFVIGGAYGFSDKIKNLASGMLSLSDMTYSHQIIRLFFEEQLYRAMTIIKGEPYHNE